MAIANSVIEHVDDTLNGLFEIERYINISDLGTVSPPKHLPGEVKVAFEEATRTLAIECWNAAGCMFRSCIDLATKQLLPKEETSGLDKHTRRYLALRLKWLFDTNLLPENLRDLSLCVKEDGNDAVHEVTLKKEDAEDLLDFTVALLERIFTEPGKLEIARKRRDQRRKESDRN